MTSIAIVRTLPFKQDGLTNDVAKSIARLMRIIRDMDIDLEWRDLGSTLRGEYYDKDRNGDGGRYYDARSLIVMNTRLVGWQVTATMGHEIAHAMYGDTESNDVTEERASRVGAALAVDPVVFRRHRLAGVKPWARRYGVTPRSMKDLGATPHAEDGCDCYPCRKFRERVLAELDELRAEHEQMRATHARLSAAAPWLADEPHRLAVAP